MLTDEVKASERYISVYEKRHIQQSSVSVCITCIAIDRTVYARHYYAADEQQSAASAW